ncbi:sensor histidine kinase [Burkholderia lata]|uniref:hybrid sensor histidine kinase/response regulator n=1 Tax=Burkholderia lata (strain ATCC 17760 / DSM 23089 / LMG 22485 / NCIMB 9086 / R18194 / 383) TaxID=482957 RepID=UPI001452E31A|nr:hybrid sensor histidine kinase/response regulator [Burkholderia lata]VWD53162.1 sensor histidine kinase [Burkholderia lata]
MKPAPPPDTYLQRFARYQRALIHGGGAIVTLAILAALAFSTVSIVDRYIARERHALALELRGVADETARFEASLRNLAVNGELMWRHGSISADAAVDRFFEHRRILSLPSHPRILVIGTDDGDLDHRKVARTIELATQLAPLFDAISHRGAMSSTTYAVSEDRSLAVLSFHRPPPPADLARVIGDRQALFRRLSDQFSTDDVKPSAIVQTASGQRPVLWLTPISDLLTGTRVIRIATVIMDHQGSPSFDIVSERPAEIVAASLPHARFTGAFVVATQDGQVIASAASDSTARSALERRIPALSAAALSSKAQEYWPDGMLVFRERYGTTNWALLYAVPWQTLLGELGAPLATGLGIIATIWILLVVFDYKVFRPMLAHSLRVSENEHLCRTLVDMHTATSLLRSPKMTKLESPVTADARGIASALLHRYAHATRVSPCTGASDRPGTISDILALDRLDAAPMQVALRPAPGRFRGRDVLVAALTNITAEHELKVRKADALRAAETANAAKSALLVTTSHEIRTPLHGMLGHLELLARSDLDTAQRNRVTTIQEAGHQLTRIVSDVLDWSKIESGEMQYEKIAFDIVTLVEQASMLFLPGARAKSLELVHAFGTIEPRYWTGDPTRIGQIVHNLLSNAIKFTERGRITLTLDIFPGNRPTDPSTLALDVDDTGIGIDPDHRTAIFDAFRQADATVTRRFGGTGLGLSLCKHFVEDMGGTISTDSAPGRGSRFQVRIPVTAATQPVANARTGALVGMTAILAVSCPEWADHVTRLLLQWGLSISASGHPAEISTAAARASDLVILWGNRSDWHAIDEDRLLEVAPRVVIASPDGPGHPAKTGHVTSVSCHTIDGFYAALGGSGDTIPKPRLTDRHDVPNALGLSILVVDDNPANRCLITEQLHTLGCDVDAVENGEQVLARLAKQHFDMLITDLNMPGMSGSELALETRRRGETLPILSISGNLSPDMLANARASGIEQTLVKPVTLNMLFDALQFHTRSDRLPRSLPEGGANDIFVPVDMHVIFATSVLDDLSLVRRACLAADFDGLRDKLHSLKGCLGAFGFETQAVQARNFEYRLDDAPSRDLLAELLEWAGTIEHLAVKHE